MSLIMAVVAAVITWSYMMDAGCSIETRYLVLAILLAGGLAGMKGD